MSKFALSQALLARTFYVLVASVAIVLWAAPAPGVESPPTILWTVTFDGGDADFASGVAVAPDGNPVVTGSSRGVWRTVKYNGANGAVIWNVTFDDGVGAGQNVAVGADGNPVVTGEVGTCGGCIATIKYDGTTGGILWNVTFPGATHNGHVVAIGSDGNPVVVGNFLVIKYDGATGAVLWTQPLSDFFPGGIVVGPDGDAVVAGDGCGGSGCSKLFKLKGANGAVVWSIVSDGGAESVGMGVDGNPVVGGSSCNPGCDFRATKYDGATGAVIWSTASNAGPGEPFGTGMAVGPDGNPVITGSTALESPPFDIRTIKYDGATGSILWNVVFDSGGADAGTRVAIGSDGNPVVVGYSCDRSCDFRVIKYLASPTLAPPSSKVNVRFHYSANGSAGGWSATKTVDSSGAITIGPQAMEGNLIVHPSDTLRTGYDLTMPGSHPAATMKFTQTTVTFQALCVSGSGGGTITINIPDLSYTDPMNSSAWYPSGDQKAASVYQGSITVPDLCSGGSLTLKQGGTFSATVGSM